MADINTVSIQEFTDEEKSIIGQMILKMKDGSGMASDERFATSIGFKGSDITNLRRENWRRNPALIGARKWLRLAQQAQFVRPSEIVVKNVRTRTFETIERRLRICQQASVCDILCDSAGIGKTWACREYQRSHPNVMYIDCSRDGKLNKFKRALAAATGVAVTGRIDDGFETAIVAIRQMNKPLLILDEGGDLEDKSIVALKCLINATEGLLGVFLAGAGGLKRRLECGRSINKTGFDEVFSRFGKDYGRITPDPALGQNGAFEEYMREEMTQVLLGNGFTTEEVRRITANMRTRDLRAVRRSIAVSNMLKAEQ